MAIEVLFFIFGILPYWYTIYKKDKDVRYWGVLIWCCCVWISYFIHHGTPAALLNNIIELGLALYGLNRMVDSSERAREIAQTYEANGNNHLETLVTCPTCQAQIDIQYYKVCGVCHRDLGDAPPKIIDIPVDHESLPVEAYLDALRYMVKDTVPNASFALCADGAVALLYFEDSTKTKKLRRVRWYADGKVNEYDLSDVVE
jgi:hypothetical protein